MPRSSISPSVGQYPSAWILPHTLFIRQLFYLFALAGGLPRMLFIFARLLRVGRSVWGGECTNRGRSSVHLLARALNSMGSASEHYGGGDASA